MCRHSWSGHLPFSSFKIEFRNSRVWAYVFSILIAAFSSGDLIEKAFLKAASLDSLAGLASPFVASGRALFIAGGVLGLGSYLGLLAVVLHRIKHFIPPAAFGKVYLWLGIALWALSFYFVYGAVQYFIFQR